MDHYFYNGNKGFMVFTENFIDFYEKTINEYYAKNVTIIQGDLSYDNIYIRNDIPDYRKYSRLLTNLELKILRQLFNFRDIAIFCHLIVVPDFKNHELYNFVAMFGSDLLMDTQAYNECLKKYKI